MHPGTLTSVGRSLTSSVDDDLLHSSGMVILLLLSCRPWMDGGTGMMTVIEYGAICSNFFVRFFQMILFLYP
jgi:hypothetical protein